MKKYRPIQLGDTVSIQFNNTEDVVVGVVKHIPCATGDCWGIHTEYGDVMYVQQFETMLIREKEGNNAENK